LLYLNVIIPSVLSSLVQGVNIIHWWSLDPLQRIWEFLMQNWWCKVRNWTKNSLHCKYCRKHFSQDCSRSNCQQNTHKVLV